MTSIENVRLFFVYLKALATSLKLCYQLGFPNIWVELDSYVVILLKNKGKGIRTSNVQYINEEILLEYYPSREQRSQQKKELQMPNMLENLKQDIVDLKWCFPSLGFNCCLKGLFANGLQD